MRKWGKRIIVGLVVGTVTTAVVAWSCALWSETTHLDTLDVRGAGGLVASEAPSQWVSDVFAGTRFAAEVPWRWTDWSGFGARAISCEVPSGMRSGPSVVAGMY